MNSKKNAPVLFLVIPCYNEEEVLPITAPMFLAQLVSMIGHDMISPESRIMFVNDGSSDNTWHIIETLHGQDEHFIGISQSRNRGHQNAVLAGLMEAKDRCDITISIDCDGQDDISAIEDMVLMYHGGFDIVYGVRMNRDSDSFFKCFTAQSYYKLLNRMGVESVYNHADYRLMSSRVLQEFANFKEVNLYLRGMVPLVGFKAGTVYYTRNERMAGKSHYPLKKMLKLAIDGITSLSIKPIRIVSGLGMVISLMGMLGVLWAIIASIAGTAVPGWASLACIVFFMGGIQCLSMGIIGEYVGKTYMESKHRPRYIISERTTDDSPLELNMDDDTWFEEKDDNTYRISSARLAHPNMEAIKLRNQFLSNTNVEIAENTGVTAVGNSNREDS